VIFIHALEVDHGLASHLVGPDHLVGDQQYRDAEDEASKAHAGIWAVDFVQPERLGCV
jgi:endonuclease YncB( thermonuclease family)